MKQIKTTPAFDTSWRQSPRGTTRRSHKHDFLHILLIPKACVHVLLGFMALLWILAALGRLLKSMVSRAFVWGNSVTRYFVVLYILQGLTYISASPRRRLSAAFASIPSDNEGIISSSSPSDHEVLLPGDVPMDIPNTQIALWKLALAGGVATMIGDAALHPMDCIKTLQQSDEGLSFSLIEAARYIWSHSGITGFYRGMGTYVITDGLGGAFKFASYEKLTQKCREIFSEGALLSVALLACAAIAFVASSLVLVPGEFLKQQLQMGHYATLGAAIQGTFAKEGLLGFYSGYDGVLLRDIPYTVLELGLYDFFKRFFHKKPSQLKVWQEIVAAAAAGGITAYATTPLDTIKTKLMVDGYSNGFMDCFLTTVDHHGIGAVFAGGMARIVWILPFTALYLPVYELLKRRLSSPAGHSTSQVKV